MSAEILKNSTVEVPTVSNGYNLIWLYITWICFFATTALPNLVVSLTVMRYRALSDRKEFLIMAGLSFSDFLETSAYSIAGFNRLWLIFNSQWSTKTSTWSCVTVIQNVVWWFSAPTCSIMLVIISLDRFFSVVDPLRYFSLTKTYAHRILSMVYGLSVFMCLLILGLTFHQMHEQSAQLAAPCFTGATVLAVNKYYAAFYMYVRSVMGVVSVVLYVGVGVVYWKKKQKQVAPNQSSNALQSKIAQDRKRQRKLSKNLAIGCMCTTIFLVIPSGVAFTAEKFYDAPRWFLQIIWLLPPINPFCNIIIYYKRQPELRKGMKALFTNKMMPQNLDLWNVSAWTTENNGPQH